MRFRLLGPLRVGDAPVPARKHRTVLAVLLAHAGRPVPIGSLVTEVWDGRPPPSAVPNVHTYVMRLRRLLPEDRLVTADGGYLLRVEPGELDLLVFGELLARAARERDPRAADEAYRRALGMWRGTPAADVPLGPALREVVAQLTDRCLRAAEEHADVRLALGAHRAAAAGLRALTRRHPLRERLHGRLMAALYRSGDVTGALEAYETARRALADELGLDPGPELRRLREAMVYGDGHRLPAETPPFVGRRDELARTHDALSRTGAVVLHGAAGVGKSALALRLAHRAADRYPDGRLYVDLRGLRAGEALGILLGALGVDEAPASVGEAAAAYRSLLAGRRALVILDNAADAAQVTPLIPAGGCAVLITSRAALTIVDATPIEVGALPRADAVRLLGLLAGESRVAAEPGAAAEVARRCGRNPLALRVAGIRLAGHPDRSLEEFGDRLRERGLAELETPGLSVRSRLLAGHDLLSGTARRLLSLLDRPEIDTGRAAALLGVTPDMAEAVLDELAGSRLLEPAGGGRFRVPPLVRLLARTL